MIALRERRVSCMLQCATPGMARHRLGWIRVRGQNQVRGEGYFWTLKKILRRWRFRVGVPLDVAEGLRQLDASFGLVPFVASSGLVPVRCTQRVGTVRCIPRVGSGLGLYRSMVAELSTDSVFPGPPCLRPIPPFYGPVLKLGDTSMGLLPPVRQHCVGLVSGLE